MAGFLLLQAVGLELRSSFFQAWLFHRLAQKATFKMNEGKSDAIQFPTYGPYDLRLGYTSIPRTIEALTERYFEVESQARQSPEARELTSKGFFFPYRAKSQAGLHILDRKNQAVYSAIRPQQVFQSLEQVPPLILSTLLFIENREVLDTDHPFRNPAVEWDRLALAVVQKSLRIFSKGRAPGGSTIATQLEKYRHSPEGRTSKARDKLEQMVSASLKAYAAGPRTMAARRQVVLDYINSIPLAALPEYGEINGLGDGLLLWYGKDLSAVMRALSGGNVLERAETFKQILSLFIAHRRPSYYLRRGRSELYLLTNQYMNLLRAHGVIDIPLHTRAKRVQLSLRKAAPQLDRVPFTERKAANAVRFRLLELLGGSRLYDLDQVDVTLQSSIDREVHQAVTKRLVGVNSRAETKNLGLTAPRLLDRGDPGKVIYSLALFERMGNKNVLRVQSDNLDRPFDINEGTRLDLGSTAKFRTLVTYLQVIEALYHQYSGMTPKERRSQMGPKVEPLSAWAVEFLDAHKEATLETTLSAALEREYSASPAERFFTGGGMHTFSNFKKEDDRRTVTVREAIRNSINLPFVRLMRDIVRYHKSRLSGVTTALAPAPGDTAEAEVRRRYLGAFADMEGSQFLRDFYRKYGTDDRNIVLTRFLKSVRLTPRRVAAFYRYLEPDGDEQSLRTFLTTWLPTTVLNDRLVLALFNASAPDRYNLNDRGYIMRVHPLEVWLVRYLWLKPRATFEEVLAASKDERQEVYQWLFNSKNRQAQDGRIRTLMEADAFHEIQESWHRLGYPFRSITPSLATALGASGDRPAALAELMGIVLNDGMRYPMIRLERLHFAAKTPYETVVGMKPDLKGERVLSPEIARITRATLLDVVQNGTARRLAGVFKDKEGKPLPVGGKTGTGDHRYETYGKGGVLLKSTVVSRTATFVFFIGDRYFGTVSAHVKGPEAGQYDFTSALAAELLKILAPAITPLVQQSPAQPGIQ